MRIILNIDDPILEAITKIQQQEGCPLDQVVTQLLSEAVMLHRRKESYRLDWFSKPMQARCDLADREALYAILDDAD